MDINTWLLYLLTDFIVCVTPGPAVILVSSQGLKYGAKKSFFGAMGITSGSLVYFILSALGLSAMILAAGRLFEYITYAGALYLIITGISSIYQSYKKPTAHSFEELKEKNQFNLFMQGFVTEISNPKAIIFFVALLPMFIKPNEQLNLQFLILGISSISMETLILFAYGLLADKSKKLLQQKSGFHQIQERIAGIALAGIGINLLFIKRMLK